jgi:hypothetical protein
MLGNASIHA